MRSICNRLFVCILLPIVSFSQEFNYVRYDTRDGLAGATVYDMCQDLDGFMWFGTENGLSRFDGTRFVNFTVKDGLPDNEVFELHSDNKGRVWISTFSKEICYYYQGKIYNASNSALIRKFKFSGPIAKFISNRQGTMVFSDNWNLYSLDKEDNLTCISEEPQFKQLFSGGHYLGDFDKDDRMILVIRDSFYTYKDGRLILYGSANKKATSNFIGLSYALEAPTIRLEKGVSFHEATYSNFRTTYVSTSNGALSVDTISGTWKDHFLPGKSISLVLEDLEKNLWFSTIGNGVYKLPSKETKTVRFQRRGITDNTEIFSILFHKGFFYCGLSFSQVAVLNHDLKEVRKLNLQHETEKAFNNYATNRLFCSLAFNDNVAFLGFDAFLAKLVGGKITAYSPMTAIKSIAKIDEDHILLGNSFGAFKIRAKDMEVVDTFWRSRTTKCIYFNNHYFIGTPGGLYEVFPDKSSRFLGDKHKALTRRITGLSQQGEILWVSTSDAGVVGLKDGNVVAAIDEESGLSSSICKTLYSTNDFLWIGTNKGLNKLSYQQGKVKILSFGVLDGLPSDVINDIEVLDSVVYVGTPEGMAFFNEAKLVGNSTCNLKLLGVGLSEKAYLKDGIYHFPYKNNSIVIDYTAISFRSAGEIQYYYRLTGLDTTWKKTATQSLQFPALPHGQYTFELFAINRFGIRSNSISIPINVATPFWQHWWFIVIAAILIIFLTGAWFQYRNNRNKRILEEKNSMEMRLVDLEQQALQAQMNPHFIFNCLNSIQQYFITNDGEKANKFLSIFSALVRETLHFSSQKTIRVSDEVRYLSRYLEMEKMRFGDHFDYKIDLDPKLEANFVEIPALLLQPYVENCIRHGIRHLQSGKGQIRINFKIENDVLQCIISDNGIGRKLAKAMKGKQPIEYQSRGMDLGQKRIEALNKLHQEQISIEVIDMYDEKGNATGTEVNLKIPL